MKKNIVCVLMMCCLIFAAAPAVGAVEYQEMSQVPIEQYQAAPVVQVQSGDGTVQEVPAEYVLKKDGKVYVPCRVFALVPGLAAYEQLDGQPIALVRDLAPGGAVAVYLKLQQEGEEKNFFVGSDGNTYLPLRDTCTEFGVQLQLKNNIITLKH